VEESWGTFVAQTLPVLPVRSWTLVTPWEPTNPRLDWLDELTAGHGIRTGWMGGSSLDGLAAQNPALVEYFFGDGGERLHRLMADVLRAGSDLPQRRPAEDLLEALTTKVRGLAASLNEVDPFYRYEVQIRAGRVNEQAWDADLHTASPVAWVHYRQLDEDTFLVLRLLSRCAESPRLRPITASVELDVPTDSPERRAVEDWLRYGAPFRDVPGSVTDVTGPPGTLTPGGLGRMTFMAAAGSAAELPDLEVRLLTADDAVAHTLELVDVRVSRGAHGPGMWVSGTDRSGVLEMAFLLNGADHDHDRVRMSMDSLVGQTPADVLPAVQFLGGLANDISLVLAVRGGRPLVSLWQPQEPGLRDSPLVSMARWTTRLLEVLLAVQAHTFQRVTVPDLADTSPEQIGELMRLGRLLGGQEIRATWTEVTLTRGASSYPLPSDGEFPLLATNEIQLALGGRHILLDDVERRILYHSARFADPGELASAQPGDTVRLVPGSSAEVTIAVVPTANLDG
jgi:hypothetical protein